MAGAGGFAHVPVLLTEVLDALEPALARGGVMVDATVGAGGHTLAALRRFPQTRVLGMDRDEAAIRAVDAAGPSGGRLTLVRANFEDLQTVLEEHLDEAPSAFLFDLGVSSPQLDEPERGFGYRSDAPLDMRMDRSSPLSAKEVVNAYPRAALARVIREYGEERFAGRIASRIAAAREASPIETTGRLAEIVREAIPAATRRTGPHPARRTFQAIRIEVNGELSALSAALPAALEALRPGGRVAVISYHSLEDRIAKRTFAEAASGCRCPSDFPRCVCGRQAAARVVTRRPIRPSEEEISNNRRAASARLRVAERLEVA